MAHPAPLIDLKLFRRKLFTMSILTKVITGFGLTGIGLYANQYLQLVLNMRPFTAALWSLTTVPAVVVGMFISIGLSAKIRPGVIVGSGLCVMAIGFGVLATLQADSQLWMVLVGSGTVAAGMMVTAPLIADLGRTLLGMARDAFTVGMNYAALTGVGVSFLFALVVFLVLGRVPSATSGDPSFSVAGHGRR